MKERGSICAVKLDADFASKQSLVLFTQDMAGDIDLNLNFSNLLILSCTSLDILFSRFSLYTNTRQDSSFKMIMLPARRLLLVALLFFCIVSSSASARSLRETRHVDEKEQRPNSAFNQKVDSQGGEQVNGDDLVTMDYTPAKKNPPIHN